MKSGTEGREGSRACWVGNAAGLQASIGRTELMGRGWSSPGELEKRGSVNLPSIPSQRAAGDAWIENPGLHLSLYPPAHRQVPHPSLSQPSLAN